MPATTGRTPRARGPVRALLVAAATSLALLLCSAAAATAAPAGAGVAGTTTPKAPAITKNPISVTVEEGQPATFSAAATGVPTPTVQWQSSSNGGGTWTAIPGASSTQLTIAAASTAETGEQVRAMFANSVGETPSKAAVLTVHRAPFVTTQPASTTVLEGQNAVFEAAAGGTPAPTIQWEVSATAGASWSLISGATAPTLTVSQVKATTNGYEYRAMFKNVVGTAYSEAATLSVQRAPSITRQPASTVVEGGQSATFEAAVSGLPAPRVQWQVSSDGGTTWSAIAGATADTLTIAEAQPAQDGSEYRAIFTNAAGTVTTTAATLTVHVRLLISEQPQSTIVEAGEEAVFQAAATGYPPPTVQWELSTNGGSSWTPIAGATTTQLSVTAATLEENRYEYRAFFSNAAGTAASNAAVLTVAGHAYTAVAWGENLDRQLGIGSTTAFSSVPAAVSGLKFVTAVAAGGRHSLALRADGTVVAWGDNELGQLGDGELSQDSAVPVPVSGLSGVKAISAGGNHSLALLANGTVMAWGANEYGQLGDGTTKESDVPVTVKGLTGVRAVAAGGAHSLALLANGTVMAWGENEYGQLGDGVLANSSVPVAVKGLSGVSQIAAGEAFSIALLSRGTIEGWGEDQHGQLANAGAEEPGTPVPVPVGTLTGVSAVAAGRGHALALLGNGTVMAWGAGGFGQLGDGSSPARAETPVPVSSLSGATAIAAGGDDSAALLGSGSIMTWGADRWGTLGDGVAGSGINSNVPVLVSGLRKAASVSVGGAQMLAYGEPIPAVTALSPSQGRTGGGTTVTITGANLSDATAVAFGANQATGVTVLSPTSITATAPAGSGSVDVTVTTPSGESLHTLADRFTYRLAPTITKLAPKSGPTAGGTTVVINGTELAGATSVSFGGVAASEVKSISATQVSAVAPAASVGSVNVTVSTPGGTSAIVTADRYRYTPTIEALTPGHGPVAGGTAVSVSGTGFAVGTNTTQVRFGTVLSKSVSCTSATSCTAVAPAHTAGTVAVAALVSKVASPAATGAQFTYE